MHEVTLERFIPMY